jgi:glutathione S-transferase
MNLSSPALLSVAAVTLLALLVYFWTLGKAGAMRGRHKIAAPAMTGHPEVERALRVQANTLENLVPFVIALWLCALLFFYPLLTAIVGLVWVLARVHYAVSYWRDPAKRGLGFTVSSLATILLMLGAAAGIVMRLL